MGYGLAPVGEKHKQITMCQPTATCVAVVEVIKHVESDEACPGSHGDNSGGCCYHYATQYLGGF